MKKWFNNYKKNIQRQAQCYTDKLNNVFFRTEEYECLERKLKSFRNRKAEIIECKPYDTIISEKQSRGNFEIEYLIHCQLLIKHKGFFYTEESIQRRKSVFGNEELVDDFVVNDERHFEHNKKVRNREMKNKSKPGINYQSAATGQNNYNRSAAVEYAKKWWDSNNTAYKNFELNCTNFISQCLKAGKAPMRGYPNRSQGWWYANHNWSYSWTVAHALRWYLGTSTRGLRAKEVTEPDKLIPGDVICYDFDGDGKWQHNTIVVEIDSDNMPLVNAHTISSRKRYWSYEDSPAWTEDANYKFFNIIV